MAVEPLYNESRQKLLERVRIATTDDVQTMALVDQSITDVRVGFREALGSARMVEITGYSLVENPLTDNEFVRANAANTEATWVTWLLAQRLPAMFMANGASTGDVFNDEPLTRDVDYKNTQYLKNLKLQVDKGLGMLETPAEPSTGSVKVGTVTGNSQPVFSSYRSIV